MYGIRLETGTSSGTTFAVHAISALTVAPQSLTAGNKGSVAVTLTTSTNIPIGGKLTLEFPTGFGVAANTMSSLALY